MENTMDLRNILKIGDRVWSNRVGEIVTISDIIRNNEYPIRYKAPSYTHAKRTDMYGYTSVIHSKFAIPDLVPDKNVQNWCEFRKDLPTGTPVMVSNDGFVWSLRYYVGNGSVVNDLQNMRCRQNHHYYIIPVSKFNFETKQIFKSDDYGNKD